jgi:hypothetical protein
VPVGGGFLRGALKSPPCSGVINLGGRPDEAEDSRQNIEVCLSGIIFRFTRPSTITHIMFHRGADSLALTLGVWFSSQLYFLFFVAVFPYSVKSLDFPNIWDIEFRT